MAVKIDEMAAKFDRSRTWIIKLALVLWLEQVEKKESLAVKQVLEVYHGPNQ